MEELDFTLSIEGNSDRIIAEKFFNKANKYYKNKKTEFTVESTTLARWNKDRWKEVKSFKLQIK